MKRKEVDVKRALRAIAIVFGVTSLLAACGGGGGGGGTDYSQYDPGTAAPTISAPATVTAYPGGANAFKVTVLDADTAQSNVKLTATVLSFTGLPTAPTVRTAVDSGVIGSERTVQVVLSDAKATGSAVIELQVSDGAQSARTQVAVSVVQDPHGIQTSQDVTVTYAAGSVERHFYDVISAKMHVVGALQPDTALDAAALAHAKYLAANGGISSIEISGSDYFTGASAVDRARAAGYSGTAVQDASATVPVAAANDIAATVAAAKFANSVYRSDVFRSGARNIGIGIASAGARRVIVAVLGTKTNVQRYVDAGYLDIWPEPSSFAQASAYGLLSNGYAAEPETPNSVTQDSACTGIALSVRLRDDQLLTTSAFTIEELDLSGKTLNSVQANVIEASTDTQKQLGRNVAYLVPLKPLKANTLYQARFTGKASTAVRGSADIYETWKFLTTPFDGTALIGCGASQ